MTIEELLKQQPQLGQGGASQYLYGPQQQYGGAGQYLGGLLSPELNFNAPTGTMSSEYSTPTYQPKPWTYNPLNDLQGLFKQAARENPDQAIWSFFSLAPNSAWKKTG
jgi:hypothetical protein